MINGISRSFLNRAFWSVIGNSFSKGALFVASIYFARVLGPEQYGYLGAVRNLANFLAVFAAIGLGTSLTKHISERISQGRNPRYLVNWSVKIGLTVIITIALIGFSFANSIEQYLLEYSFNGLIVVLGMGYFVFFTVNNIQIGILSGFKDFRQMAYLNLGFSIIFLSVGYYLSTNFGLKGVFYTFNIAYIVIVFSYYVFIQRRFKIYSIIKESKDIKTSFLKFSGIIGVGGTIYSVSIWINYMLLVKISDYENGGIFAAATIWANTILFIPTALSKLILASFSSMNNKHKSFKDNFFNYSLLITSGITLSLIIISLSLMPLILDFYGPGYESLKSVFIILSIYTLSQSIGGVCDNFLISQNRAMLLQLIQIGRQVTTILLALLFLLFIRKDAFGLAIGISIGGIIGDTSKFIASKIVMKEKAK